MDVEARGVPAPGGATFKYIFDREGCRDRSEVLSEVFSASDPGFVVRDEVARKFRMFPSPEMFWEWADTVPPGDRCFHEVVFGAHAQRIKFDIDASRDGISLVPQRLTQHWLLDETAAEDAERALDELIFDIPDAGVRDPRPVSPADQCAALLEYLVGVIMDAFHAMYYDSGAVLAADQILVASSMGVPWAAVAAGNSVPEKYSFHIVVTSHVVSNNREAKHFTGRVLDIVRAEVPEIIPLIDPSINSGTQNFRLLGSHKEASPRTKVVDGQLAAALGTMAPDPSRERALLQIGRPTNVRALPALCGAEAAPEITITDGDIRAALDCVHAHLPGAQSYHRFSRNIGPLMLFDRLAPSYCSICLRVHSSDNSLMVVIRPDDSPPANTGNAPAGAQPAVLIELCRRSPAGNSGRRIATIMCAPGTFAGTTLAHRGQTDDSKEARLKAVIDSLNSGSRDPSQGSDRMFVTNCPTTRYSEPAMRNFEHVPTLAVMAQMGLGKTRALRKYISDHFSARPGSDLEAPPVIRFITFRQTFSESLRKQFGGFSVYSDIAGHNIRAHAHPRLIIQVESLHRLLSDVQTGSGEPDLLVLDEIESVLAQFSSGLHRSFHESFAVFQWLISCSKHVVCMDANLSDRSYRTLEAMRPHALPYLHHNEYLRAGASTMHLTSRRDDWVAHLVTQVGNGKRISLASNSRREAEAIKRVLEARYPDKNIRMYSSETPYAERVMHFADVNTYWRDLDVLIYTPTVSAGVSYEVGCDMFDPAVAPAAGAAPAAPAAPDGVFDCMYVYLSDMSCDVETGRQMLGRVRVLRDQEYFVCISSIPRSHPTDIGVLERLAYDQRRSLQDSAWVGLGGAKPARYRFDPQTGTIQPYRTPYFALWLENARIANLSRNAYGERFADQAFLTGVKMCWLEPLAGGDDAAGVAAERKAATSELRAIEVDGVATALELTHDDVRDIRSRQESTDVNTVPVSEGERRAMTKYFLRQCFHWDGDISPAMAAKLMRPSIQRIFKNLEIAMGAPSMEAAIDGLRADELAFYSATVSCSSPGTRASVAQRLEQSDIRRKYKYPAHYYALRMLHMCGFQSINDPARLPEPWVIAQLWGARVTIIKALTLIVETLQVRRPSTRDLNSDDLETVGRKVLQLVNSSLRKMYGVEVKVDKRRGTAHLAPTKDGQVVWPSDGPASSPRVVCHLQRVPVNAPALAALHLHCSSIGRRTGSDFEPYVEDGTALIEDIVLQVAGGVSVPIATPRRPEAARDLIELAKMCTGQ
jgi:hypothetical protein